MKFLITGADGFIGKNLQVYLNEVEEISYLTFTRRNAVNELPELLTDVDAVIHLAGVNRPKDDSEFIEGNLNLTEALVSAIIKTGRKIPVLCTSSIQAERDNPYGASKKAGEDALLKFNQETSSPVAIYRLANVFGKWCKPNYNSMVATFCHNVCRGLDIQVHDGNAAVNLVYIDDVIAELTESAIEMVNLLSTDQNYSKSVLTEVSPVYNSTVREIADLLYRFKESRNTLVTERVGDGFLRKLYSTYVSYFPTEHFTYQVPKHGDERGVFVEMLKTPDAGQFSFFTAHPGITRGGHYHHTKTEKFLVIKGKACFRFRHMITGEFYELFTTGETPEIVETVPGWSHDITNVGDDEMVVMLWANEIFDRENPDTYASPVGTE